VNLLFYEFWPLDLNKLYLVLFAEVHVNCVKPFELLLM